MTSYVSHFAQAPVVPVLRGISPGEVLEHGEALHKAGLRCLEITLDSPEPFASIALLKERFGVDTLIAAGTVLEACQAERAAESGADMIVAPNFCTEVVRATIEVGLVSVPGVMTPTEAFHALNAGAHMLKVFPGDALSPAALKGFLAVLPKPCRVMVTGGITHANLRAYLDAGAVAVGIGSALYKPGKTADEVEHAAREFLALAQGHTHLPSPASSA